MNLNNLIEGWANVISTDPLVEKLAEERAKICAECPFLHLKSVCGKCGCPVLSKTRSLKSTCPLFKWKPATLLMDKETKLRSIRRSDGTIIKL